jgi:hypothetical protein
MDTNLGERFETTDLERVRRTPARFTWGKVLAIHDIGRYTIAEYKPRKVGHNDTPAELAFHVWVDGRCTHSSESTLERALVLAIAHGTQQGNAASHFAVACYKILDLK